jgi:hypothetical protein
MKLPIYKRIRREDVPDLPDSIGRLLYPLNSFMDTVWNTLNKNITFADNFQSFQKSLEFTTNANYTSGVWEPLVFAIPDTFKVRVSGVLVLQLLPKDISLVTNVSGLYVAWREIDRTVEVPWIGGLADSTTYNVSFLVV